MSYLRSGMIGWRRVFVSTTQQLNIHVPVGSRAHALAIFPNYVYLEGFLPNIASQGSPGSSQPVPSASGAQFP
jgi:hypothetical protein